VGPQHVLPSPTASMDAPRGAGILSIRQSSFSMSGVLVEKSEFVADLDLNGWGEAYSDCGLWFKIGCLSSEKHLGRTLDGRDFSDKGYFRRVRHECFRPDCPVCWKSWAFRETKRAERRIFAFGLKGRSLKPIHLVVSVPWKDYVLSLEEMRVEAYKSLRAVHCLGGMMIYHPKRFDDDRQCWYFSPHFHVIGYGWILDVRRNYVVSGYIVKNVGVRKSVGGTIWYQVSHCGVSKSHHVVTWFGGLSYNKLRLAKEVKKRSVCPICGDNLHRVVYIGQGESCQDLEFYDDPVNWIIVSRRGCWDDG